MRLLTVFVCIAWGGLLLAVYPVWSSGRVGERDGAFALGDSIGGLRRRATRRVCVGSNWLSNFIFGHG